MRIVRNWLLPVLLVGLGALLGLVLLGLPGLNIVQTIDGSPVVGGYIPPEQVPAVIREGRTLGSYIDLLWHPAPGPAILLGGRNDRSFGILRIPDQPPVSSLMR